jgi:hypothetical protein
VEVVGGEENAVREPVDASERAIHARKEEPAEEEFLAEHRVEDPEDDDDGEPAPGAVQEPLGCVGVEKHGEVVVAIGRAAAAQTARIRRTEYCGISTEAAASGSEGFLRPPREAISVRIFPPFRAAWGRGRDPRGQHKFRLRPAST